MARELLLNKNVAEIYEFVEAAGQPAYRARQLLEWIYQKRAASFDELTSLPKRFKRLIKGRLKK